MDNFFDIPGMENVDFQINSKLASRLEAIFQDVIDLRNTAEPPHDASDLPSGLQKSLWVKQQVMTHCKNVMVPALIKAIKEETGLEFEKITLTGDTISGPSFFFAVDVSFDDLLASVDMEARETGTATVATSNVQMSANQPVEEMKEMASLLDVHTSKLKATKYGPNKKRRIRTELFFDPVSAFLMSEYVTDSFVEDTVMTAAEITAIVLHEIGHMMTIIEHSADLYAVSKRIQNQIHGFSFEGSAKSRAGALAFLRKDFPAFVKDLRKRTAQLQDAGDFKFMLGLCDKALVLANGLASRLEEAKPTDEDEGAGTVILNLFWHAILIAFRFLFQFGMITTGAFYMLMLLKDLGQSGFVDRTLAGGKAGDVKTTRNNVFLIERWADEFVSRHGYSGDLATGLRKLYAGVDATEIGVVFSQTLRESKAFNLYAMLMVFVIKYTNIFTYLPIVEPTMYETLYKRIKRQKEQQLLAFKSIKKGVPEAEIRRWISNVERIETSMKETAPYVVSREFADACNHLVGCIIDPVEWYRCLNNGQLERDYSILHNRIDAIRDNALYYWSEKLKRS